MTLRRRVAIVALGLAAAGGPRPGASAQAAPATAIEGATIIDGTGRPPIADGVVLLRDSRIEAVGSRAAVAVPPDARRVDARGKFLVPGLIDAHAHVRENWMDELFLAHGVTSVATEGQHLEWDLAQQDGRAREKIRGPRFFTAGMTFRCRGAACRGADYQPERLRARIAALARAGVAKIAIVQFQPPDVLRVIVEEAHRHGMPVSGETFFVREASAFGFDAVAHTYGIAMGAVPDDVRAAVLQAAERDEGTDINPLSYLVPPASDALRERLLKGGVSLVPMLVNDMKAVNDRVREFREDSARLLYNPDLDYLPAPDLAAAVLSVGPRGVPPLATGMFFFGSGYYGTDDPPVKEDGAHRQNYRNVQAFLSGYARAGGKILTGTDVGNYVLPGLSVIHEMQLLADAGLTTMQALQAATLWPAEFLRRDADIGSVRPGRFADLVILDANPLDDPANAKRVRKVFKNGIEQDITFHRDYRNPIPVPPAGMTATIDTLSPASVVEGSGDVELTLRGGAFIRESIVRVGGVRVPTRFVVGSRIVATVPASLTAQAGTLPITVENPSGAPRGGVSRPAFLIVRFQ